MNKYKILLLSMLVVSMVFIGCNDKGITPVEEQGDFIPIQIDGWEISKSELDFEVDPMPRDMYFINATTGYFVGYWGEIYKTTDAGSSWQKQNSGTTLQLYSVFFLDENTGFVSGRAMDCLDDDCDKGCLLLKTIDGGKTWGKTFFKDYIDIHCLHFFDNLNGVAIIYTEQGIPNTKDRFLAKTSDGGNSWNSINLDIFYATDNLYCFDNILFIAGENQKVFKSKDHGNNWETIDTPLPAWDNVQRIFFYNENIGYINGSNIYKTIDGGLNWKMIDFPFSYFETFHFYNETEGFNIKSVSEYEGGDYPTYKGCIVSQTNDGGATWKNSPLIYSYPLGLTYFVQPDLGYAINPPYFFKVKRK